MNVANRVRPPAAGWAVESIASILVVAGIKKKKRNHKQRLLMVSNKIALGYMKTEQRRGGIRVGTNLATWFGPWVSRLRSSRVKLNAAGAALDPITR